MTRMLLAVVVLMTGTASAKVLCPPGEFELVPSGTGLVRGESLAERRLVLGQGRAEVTGLCARVAARRFYRAHGNWGHRVAARFARCKGGRPIGLRATWDLEDAPWCSTLEGELLLGRGRRVSFRAVRVPACGNGLRDAGEQCDDGNTAAGDCCAADCQAEAGCAVACDDHFPCGADEQCVPACGGATCRPRATLACGGGPVCGCDLRTQFADQCAAWEAGQGVGRRGACPRYCDVGEPADCLAGEFCGRSLSSCTDWLRGASRGACTAVPAQCDDVENLVCGCDGKTYRNRCLLARARMSAAHGGACQ